MIDTATATILQRFYQAVNAKELTQACQFLSADVRFATLDGDLKGKTQVCRYLQALIRADVTFVIRVQTCDAETVRYAYHIFAQDVLIDAGENGLAYLCNGLICFDGTENNNSYSRQET